MRVASARGERNAGCEEGALAVTVRLCTHAVLRGTPYCNIARRAEKESRDAHTCSGGGVVGAVGGCQKDDGPLCP